MTRYTLILILVGLLAGMLPAQTELGTHFMRGTWQAQHTNPALVPEGTFTIKLPDVYNDIYISSITYNDLIRQEGGGKAVLDIDNAIEQLDDDNIIWERLQVGTIGFGINLGPVNLNIQHGMRYNAFINYPKALPQLIWQGNAQFVGQQVDAGTDVQVFGYHELAVGAAVTLADRLTIGGRFKYLSGIAEASTERQQLRVYTDSVAYALELDADLLVNSSGTVRYESFRDLEIGFDFGRFDLDRVISRNNGYAVDLGAHLDLGKLQLAASVLDLGQIDWDEDVSNYALTGTKDFAGLDVSQGILEDSEEFGSVIDSLEAAFDVVETNRTFTTELGAKLYLSAAYQFDDTWRFGVLYYQENYRGEARQAAAVAANACFWPFLELGATYAWRNDTFDNIGLNAMLKAGPVQLVAATDNILTAVQLKDSNSANIRLGVNVVLQ